MTIKNILKRIFIDGLEKDVLKPEDYEYDYASKLSQIYQELKRCVPEKADLFPEELSDIMFGRKEGGNEIIDEVHKNLKKACGVE